MVLDEEKLEEKVPRAIAPHFKRFGRRVQSSDKLDLDKSEFKQISNDEGLAIYKKNNPEELTKLYLVIGSRRDVDRVVRFSADREPYVANENDFIVDKPYTNRNGRVIDNLKAINRPYLFSIAKAVYYLDKPVYMSADALAKNSRLYKAANSVDLLDRTSIADSRDIYFDDTVDYTEPYILDTGTHGAYDTNFESGWHHHSQPLKNMAYGDAKTRYIQAKRRRNSANKTIKEFDKRKQDDVSLTSADYYRSLFNKEKYNNDIGDARFAVHSALHRANQFSYVATLQKAHKEFVKLVNTIKYERENINRLQDTVTNLRKDSSNDYETQRKVDRLRWKRDDLLRLKAQLKDLEAEIKQLEEETSDSGITARINDLTNNINTKQAEVDKMAAQIQSILKK